VIENSQLVEELAQMLGKSIEMEEIGLLIYKTYIGTEFVDHSPKILEVSIISTLMDTGKG
jgi:hypothetical protein